MNRREALVFFCLWLIFPIMAWLAWPSFIGGIAFEATIFVPVILILAHFEKPIERWFRAGDKKSDGK